MFCHWFYLMIAFGWALLCYERGDSYFLPAVMYGYVLAQMIDVRWKDKEK